MIRKFEQHFLKLLAQQDVDAFNQLYLQTVDVFYRYLKNNFFIEDADSKDIIADFYVKLWNALLNYDVDKPISGYMRTIFKNIVKDFFKKNKDLPFTLLEKVESDCSFEETLIDEKETQELLEQNFKLEIIQEAMQALDILSREILILKYIEEKDNKEIENILQISQSVIRQRISRALKQLRDLLSGTY